MRYGQWAAGLGLLILVAACGKEEVRRGEPYTPPPAAEEEAAVFGETEVATLPPSMRAALVTAHAEAAIALYVAGETDAAKAHLEHADSALHPDLLLGLDTMGFDPEPLNVVYDHIESGMPGSEAGSVLDAARDMLRSLRAGAGGDAATTIEFLMKALAREYEKGADTGEITDPEAYQFAWGLAVAARQVAAEAEPETYDALRRELDFLVLMWPAAGPISGGIAAPEAQMADQLSRVKLILVSLP
jgi:hypothetical protein